MTQRVDIINIALTFLGEEEVTSIEDDSDRARIMKINYEAAKDATLEAHDWSFAIKRFIPGEDAETPVWGPGRRFLVPSDIIRVVGCWPNTGTSAVAWTNTLLIDSDEQIDWVMEDGYILCDEEVVYAKGVRRIDTEGDFSPLFVLALSAQLAAMGCLPITSDTQLLSICLTVLGQRIDEAKTRDGLQGRSRRIRQRSLRKVR